LCTLGGFDVVVDSFQNHTEAETFATLDDLLKQLPHQKGRAYDNALKSVLDGLIDISTEIRLLKEVKDIRDELRIIIHLITTQTAVLEVAGNAFKDDARSQCYELKSELERHLQDIREMDNEAGRAYVAVRAQLYGNRPCL
jgi:hypothetical protein